MSRSRSNFLAQLERAQFIAFSPFIFQAAAAALRTGLLETLSRSPGQNVAGAAAAIRPHTLRGRCFNRHSRHCRHSGTGTE